MLTNIETLIDNSFGIKGTPERDALEERAELFVITEMLKEARKEAHLTQAQLAELIGAKKGYISRIENGKTDIQLRTLKRIVEKGLGKKLKLAFE
ncbi:helix-turn-helix transcriptional regulator [Runella sp.]|jgi:DNA-binding XRE family transcriptional regulator|uniref:helix-turn-helix domain-containing protein n=1 Tax=Runella sp. TaxID=1960881 RepID=UPI00301B17C3